MDDTGQHPFPESEATPPTPRLWIAPTIFLVAILVPALILIFSNTDSTPVSFAWFEWSAPHWLILAVTFAAGALVTRLIGWTWRTMRRRQRRES